MTTSEGNAEVVTETVKVYPIIYDLKTKDDKNDQNMGCDQFGISNRYMKTVAL